MSGGVKLKPPSKRPLLQRLDYDGRVEAMVEWFRHNFESPENRPGFTFLTHESYYEAGGPYDPRIELEEYFPEATVEELGDAETLLLFEQEQFYDWAPAAWRIQPEDYSADAEFEQPIAERVAALRGQLGALEEQLAQLLDGGSGRMGHNQPPEDKRLGLERQDIFDAQESIAEIRAELDRPDALNGADPRPIQRAEGRFRTLLTKVRKWVLAAGGVIGAGMLQQMGSELWANPQALIRKLQTIADTLQAWASHLQIPF